MPKNYPLEPYLEISAFTAHLLNAFISLNEATIRKSITYCRNYLAEKIDRTIQPTFYCVYEDIRRVLEHKKEVLLSSHTERERLEEMLDKLQRKHMYFQIHETHRAQKRFPSTNNTLVAHFQQMSESAEGERGEKRLKDILNKFEWINTIMTSSGRRKPSYPRYFVMRDFIGNEIEAAQSIIVDIDFLLDHGSLFIEYLSDTLQSSHYNMPFEAFTALMPEKLRRSLSRITNGSKRTGLADYFYVDLNIQSRSSPNGLARILSKKLICLDPVTQKRIFVNPTVGCSIQCDYCYLPDYGIRNDKLPKTPTGISGQDYRRAIERFGKPFREGNDGTLISIGSFCDPFLDRVTAKRTVEILRALQDWQNPIQIATKMFLPNELVQELKEIFRVNKSQFMINISVNDPNDIKWRNVTSKWLRHSSDLNLTIYIKPVRDVTVSNISEYIRIGRQYENLFFVIGSLYLGDNFRDAMNSDERAKFRRQPELVSPVVPIPSTPGFRHNDEDEFAAKLRAYLGNRIFRTASCALSAKYQISDPLDNFNGFFCVRENCPNYSICNRAINGKETGRGNS